MSRKSRVNGGKAQRYSRYVSLIPQQRPWKPKWKLYQRHIHLTLSESIHSFYKHSAGCHLCPRSRSISSQDRSLRGRMKQVASGSDGNLLFSLYHPVLFCFQDLAYLGCPISAPGSGSHMSALHQTLYFFHPFTCHGLPQNCTFPHLAQNQTSTDLPQYEQNISLLAVIYSNRSTVCSISTAAWTRSFVSLMSKPVGRQVSTSPLMSCNGCAHCTVRKHLIVVILRPL